MEAKVPATEIIFEFVLEILVIAWTPKTVDM